MVAFSKDTVVQRAGFHFRHAEFGMFMSSPRGDLWGGGGAEVSVKIQARDVGLGVARVLGAVDLHEVTQDPFMKREQQRAKEGA